MDATVTDWNPTHNNFFACAPKFRSVHTSQIQLLRDLPSSVREVSFSSHKARSYDSDATQLHVAAELGKKLSSITPHLTTLVLIGAQTRSAAEPRYGKYDRLISRLRDVQHLVVPAFAVTSLSTSLKSLAYLTRVEIYNGGTYGSDDLARLLEDILQLVVASTALKQLVVDVDIVEDWDDLDRQTLEQTAQQHNVQLIVAGEGAD